MLSNILIFEDESVDQLYPLVLTRPVFELRCGMFSLLEKLAHRIKNAHYSFFCRDYLKPSLLFKYPNVPVNVVNSGGGLLLINGRLIYSDRLFAMLAEESSTDFVWISDKTIVLAYLRSENINLIKPLLENDFNNLDVLQALRPTANVREVEATLIQYPWDLIRFNRDQMEVDFRLTKMAGVIKGDVNYRAYLYDESNVYVGKNSEIMAGCVIDARSGPVYIGENVLVKAGSYLEGPVFLGDNTVVSRGYLRLGSNVGKYCRVGGEIEESVFHSYSNKYHDGFVGHSYIASWVNLGALTTTSDLKNNYSSIRMTIMDRSIDTGMKFLGAIIGDHTKLGIGTLLSTGSILGVGCNLYGGGLMPRFVSDFVWGSPDSYQNYDLDKFLATAENVMKRREEALSLHDTAMLRAVYQSTATLRASFLTNK